MNFVYILKSSKNGKSYVGSTEIEVKRRLSQHNIGSNKWTKGNKPFILVYYESFVCKQDALLREKFLKTGVGRKLKKIILDNFGV